MKQKEICVAVTDRRIKEVNEQGKLGLRDDDDDADDEAAAHVHSN